MIRESATTVLSLGDEPLEVLGFNTEEELEIVLLSLMSEVATTENIGTN